MVADEQRSLALGVQSVLWRVFGTVPGPLLFGLLFDSACQYWQLECGRRGNCWVYDNKKLSYYALAFSASAALLAAVFAGLAWFTYPKHREEKEEKVPSAESDPSNGSTSIHDSTIPMTAPFLSASHPPNRPASLTGLKKADSRDQLLQATPTTPTPVSGLSSDSPGLVGGVTLHELRSRSVKTDDD